MARAPQLTDFIVNVDGVGRFVFAKRTMRDEISIQVEYAKMLDGVEPTQWLSVVCGWLSVLSVLTVRAPDGWSLDLDDLDPMDPEVYERLSKVHAALVEQERSFRPGPKPRGEAGGAAAAQVD